MAYEMTGAGVYGPYFFAGTPVAGTNEVQTLTLGGTITGGSITLSLDGLTTAPITHTIDSTKIQTALDAKFGASQIVAAGAGPFTLTFSGSNYARRAVSTMTVGNNLTGTSPTAVVTETTPGVTQTGRDVAVGAILLDTTGKKLYINTGAAGNPTWTVVGSQV